MGGLASIVQLGRSALDSPIDAQERRARQILFLTDVTGLNVGDWIMAQADATPEFIEDHNMTGTWTTSTAGGVAHYRRIEQIWPAQNKIKIDIPTRYWLLTRDNARVVKVPDHLSEVGIEGFDIGKPS